MTSHGSIVAAIDIGSNTIKLTVARLGDGLPEEIASKAEVVRLSEGLALTGEIRPDRLERGVEVLTGLTEIARELGAVRIEAVATEATRSASNGQELLSRIRQATGVEVAIISGPDEAQLTADGVLVQIDARGRVLIVDIGGGSTELIESRDGVTGAAHSIPIGSGTMTDLYVVNDPPSSFEVDTIVSVAREQAGSFLSTGASGGKLVLVGGTGEYLMRVSGSGNPMELSSLNRGRERSLALTAEQLAIVSSAPVARARVLPAGFAIAQAITDLAHPDSLESVPNGLRIGLLLRVAAGAAACD